MSNIDKEFDNKIRSLMQDAQEEVPDFLWKGIEASLDSVPSAQPHRPVFRLVRILAPVAAAAAIAAGIFFAVSTPSSQPQPPVLADDFAIVDDFAATDASAATDAFAATEAIALVDDFAATDASAANYASADIAAMDDDASATEAIAHVASADTLSSDSDSEALSEKLAARSEEVENDSKTDPGVRLLLADLIEEEEPSPEKRRPSMQITIAGNTSTGPNEKVVNVRPLRVISNMTPQESCVTETGLSDYGMPVSLGVGVKFILSPRWSLGTALNFTSMGREFAGTYTNVRDGKIIFKEAFKDIRNGQSYLGISANAYFSMIKRSWLDFYVYAGAGADHCISNIYQMYGQTSRYSHRDDLGSLQFSVKAGLGVEFIIADYIGVYLDPSVAYHFKNKGTLKNIRSKYPVLPSLEIGLRFRL